MGSENQEQDEKKIEKSPIIGRIVTIGIFLLAVTFIGAISIALPPPISFIVLFVGFIAACFLSPTVYDFFSGERDEKIKREEMTNRAKDNQQKQKVAESAYFESKNQSNFDSVNNKNEKKEMKN